MNGTTGQNNYVSTLNNNHMQSYVTPIQNQVYLNSDRTMCIKLKIELQTSSNKMSQVMFGKVHHTSQADEHIS